MCRVSEKLKLCTCNTDVSKLKHYWVLHRFSKNKNLVVIGEAIMPIGLSFEDEKFNRESLLKLLNEGNVFDIDVAPANRDRLQLTFTMKIQGAEINCSEQVCYGFEYANKQWRYIEFDNLAWLHRHDEERYGKILHATERK